MSALRWMLTLLAALLVVGCATGTKPGEEVDASVVDAPPAPDCTTDTECDDGVACTTDTCGAGECIWTPDDTQCDATEMCEAGRGCVLRPPCASDDDCDDAAFCNGAETCDPATGCQAGIAPPCDDGLGCTDDSCDPAANECAHEANHALCTNGIICDGDEACVPTSDLADANGCLAGTALDCDDGVDCTIDTCSEGAGGCERAPDDASCTDGVFCNGDEICDATTGCGPGTAPDCDDGIACTLDTCDGATDMCARTTDDAMCDDGLICNGAERCDTTGCVGGTAVDCSDGLACTTDRCIEPTGACEQLGSDADSDGFEALGCGTGDDCNDLVPAVNPGAAEICDGVDNDCSGGVDDGSGMECVLGSAPSACSTMCGTAGTRPCNGACRLGLCVAATETCNGCDDDGDGVPDDGLGCRQGTTSACTTTCGTAGSQACAADCSGFGTCAALSETCNDCDDDVDGSTDEGFACRRGSTQSCTTVCGTTGLQTCALDCGSFGACIATEICNGCDDDSDGVADDGFTCRQGALASCTTACGTAGTQQCNATCSAFGVCAAGAEICGNGCDDDGNGVIDDGCGAPNDVCTGATVLSGASGTTTDTYSFASRSVTDCVLGGELWYQLTVSSRSVVYVDTLGSSIDTALSLRTGCGAAAVQCEDDDCGTVQEQLVRVLDAGTYFIAVHAFSASTTSGSINLRWQMAPAGNGTYTRFTTNGTYSGTTSGSGTRTSGCGGSGPEDGWYFTLCPSVTRTVSADTCSGTSFDSVLSIQGVSEVACDDDGCGLQSDVSGSVSGPGVYVIQVDGYGSGAGPYQLSVSGL